MTLLPDQLITTSQNGSSTDKRTQRLVDGRNSFPTDLIPWWERILREWEKLRTIEVSDITGDTELEDKEQSPLVDAEEPSVSRRRSEHSMAVQPSFHSCSNGSFNASKSSFSSMLQQQAFLFLILAFFRNESLICVLTFDLTKLQKRNNKYFINFILKVFYSIHSQLL